MIISKENEKIKKLIKLKNNKKNDLEFLVEGENFKQLAIDANCLVYSISNHEELLNDSDLLVSLNIMKLLSTTDSVPKIISLCLKKECVMDSSNYLFLDDIQDPGNLGSIIRSALAFDVKNIVLSNNCVNIYNQKVLRSTQGAIFKINFIYDDLIKMIEKLKDEYTIYGTSLENGKILKKEHAEKFVLIVGNEGHGVSENILKITHENIFIPIKNIESLNVAIATSIILYEWRKI